MPRFNPKSQVLIHAELDPQHESGVYALRSRAEKRRNLKTVWVRLPETKGTDTEERRKKLQEALSVLNGDSRVLLDGHCLWEMLTLGGETAEKWASELIRAGLPAVMVIDVLGCSAGHEDLVSAHHARTSTTSFARELHKALKDSNAKDAPVIARIYDTAVCEVNDEHYGTKLTFSGEDDVGLNITFKHQTGSKVQYTWNGATQLRTILEYNNAQNISVASVY
jgi:LmbE family N-acetylglucosaminyl deacetylase